MDKPPVEPENYLHGVKVVDIGDLRVARGRTRRPRSSCKHKRLNYDPTERRVWCEDCEQEVEPFDAFIGLVDNFAEANRRLERRADEIKEAEQFTLRRRATKALDKVWRGKMLPVCVNCGEGMLPEDYTSIGMQVCREIGEAQKRRRKK